MPRKENLTIWSLGLTGAALMGIGMRSIVLNVENQGNQQRPLSENEVSQMLYTYERSLSGEEFDFIVTELSEYLTPETLQKIARMSYECSTLPNGSEAVKRLIFIGVPLFDGSGSFRAFVPKAITCGTVDASGSASKLTTVSVPPFDNQLLSLAMGYTQNTLDAEAGGNDLETQRQYLFGTKNVSSRLPNYIIGSQGNFLKGNWQGDVVEQILSDEQFAKALMKKFYDLGLCGFVPPELAKQRQKIDNRTFPLKSTEHAREWTLDICVQYLSQVANIPASYSIDAFPPEINTLAQSYLGNHFPLTPDANNTIQATRREGNQIKPYTLFSQNPGIVSTTMGWSPDQLVLPPDENSLPIPSFPASVLMTVLGAAGVSISTHMEIQKRKRHPVKKTDTGEKKVPKRQPWVPSTHYDQTAYLTRDEKREEIKQEETTFTLNTGVNQITLSSAQDVLPYILEAIPSPLAKQRLEKKKTREELVDLVEVSFAMNGDFTQIYSLLETMSKRTTPIHVGGDSVTISYHITDENRTPVGYLLLDMNVEEGVIETIFFEESPTPLSINEYKDKIAEETVVDAGYSIKEAASFITAKIETILNAQHLNEEQFLALKNECAALIEQTQNYSQVKQEVKRKLTELIEANMIPILFKSKRQKNMAPIHPKIIADRIYDYMNDTQTSESDFAAFTNQALSLLENGGYTALKQTAGKAWETRTGYRIQIVQAMYEGQRQIVVLFTDNSH